MATATKHKQSTSPAELAQNAQYMEQLNYPNALRIMEGLITECIDTVRRRQRMGRPADEAWRWFRAMKQYVQATHALLAKYEGIISEQRRIIQRQNEMLRLADMEARFREKQRTPTVREKQIYNREGLREQSKKAAYKDFNL